MKNIRIILEDISKRELNETLLTPTGKMLAGVAGVLGALGVGGVVATNMGGRPSAQVPVTATVTAPVTAPVTSPNTTPTQPNKAEETVHKTYQFVSEPAKRLYGALVSAEHRGVVGRDPFAYDPKLSIRTEVSSDPKSSAYGPVQITRSTARGFISNPNEYEKLFIQQGSNFLASTDDHSIYGLGAAGDLSDPKHHADYMAMAEKVMLGKAKELKINITKQLSPDELTRFIQHWRHGIHSSNKPEKWYSAAVKGFYDDNKPKQPNETIVPNKTGGPLKESCGCEHKKLKSRMKKKIRNKLNEET